MNRKTVLFLMNGFGIESKLSYSIYDASLMPTLDMLTKNYLFSTIKSDVSNYYDGYRNASLDVEELYNYQIIDKEIENKKIFTNSNLVKLKQDVDTKKGNLHIFSLIDTSPKIVDHLKEILKYLNPNKNKKIYLHFIMTSNDISDYKKIVELFSKLNIEFANTSPISFIMGLSAIDNTAKQVDLNFFFKMFISKVGEKWQSFTQKFDVLSGTKVIPRNCKPFMINTNFSLEKDDIFYFNNYDNLDLTNFINTLSNITFGTDKNNFSFYSLFKLKSNIDIPNMYESTISPISLVKSLENIDANATIVCPKERVNVINYFCNGLQNMVSGKLTFNDLNLIHDNPTSIVSLINNSKSDLIIIDYNIDNCKNTLEIKEKLKIIDNSLKAIYDNINGSKYTLIVSSLYGISKAMTTENNNICQVIFSGKVPFIFVDDFITKKNYLITNGSINGIFKSCYKNIKNDSKYESLVDKQNGLYRLFFK